MNIQAVRSDALYRKMMGAEQIEKENIYRNELMKPFEFKWMCVGIPLKAEIVGGFDVVSSAGMSGFYAPMQITEERCDEVQKSAMMLFGTTAKIVFAIPSKILRGTGFSSLNKTMCLRSY